MIAWTGTLKIFAIIFAASVLFGLVINIGLGAYEWAVTGNPRPLLDNTAGVLLNADKMIFESVYQLADQEKMKANPDIYSNLFVDYLKQRIIFAFCLLIFVIAMLYLFFNKLTGIQQFEPLTNIMVFLLVVLLLGILQMGYVLVVDGRMIIPYQGVWALATHPGVLVITPESYVESPDLVGFKVFESPFLKYERSAPANYTSYELNSSQAEEVNLLENNTQET